MKISHCYLGIKPCGCVPAISADDGFAGEFVKDLLDRGYIIERCTSDEGRKRFGYNPDCELCKEPKTRNQKQGTKNKERCYDARKKADLVGGEKSLGWNLVSLLRENAKTS